MNTNTERISELEWKLKELHALYKDVIDGTVVMDYESLVNLVKSEVELNDELDKLKRGTKLPEELTWYR